MVVAVPEEDATQGKRVKFMLCYERKGQQVCKYIGAVEGGIGSERQDGAVDQQAASVDPMVPKGNNIFYEVRTRCAGQTCN